MNPDLLPLIANSFGFNPDDSSHHFLIDIRRSPDDPIYISEHISWDENVGSCATNTGKSLDGLLRVILPANKWRAIADEVGVVFNVRLRKQGSQPGKWRVGQNLLRSDIGKELVLLAWAIEDADASLIPSGILNWKGLAPEERWWLFTQTAATTGRAIQVDRNIGWRKAIRFALTENPTNIDKKSTPDFYQRALNPGLPKNDGLLPTTQGELFGNKPPAEEEPTPKTQD